MTHHTYLIALLVAAGGGTALGSEIAITIDDPGTGSTLLYSPVQRDERIRKALRTHRLQSALFVCGMRVDNPEGKALLKKWDREGHVIGNHTYSHRNLNSPIETVDQYEKDIERVEPLLIPLKHFSKLFRFPMLKEGDSRPKRDAIRKYLEKNGYSMGYVTVDASDWYIDSRLSNRLKNDPNASLDAYRDYYLEHLWDRMQFYDSLMKQATGGSSKHTLLIHHNLLNALFLDEVLKMIKAKGWKLISAASAFQDHVHQKRPDTVPAGESITWALAKESKCCDSKLRYPAEDGSYEKVRMDNRGL
jgi:peptidoglycan-N-acetylglucosamine deacetylase